MGEQELIRKQRRRRTYDKNNLTGFAWRPSPRNFQIYEAHARGDRKVVDIAEQFGLSTKRIYAIVRRTGEWIARESLDNIRRIKAAQATRLEIIYQEAMQAWARSIGEVTKVTTGTRDGIPYTSTVKEIKAGHADYLATAMKALEDIRKIWGANEPEKIEFSDGLRVGGLSRTEGIKRIAMHYLTLVADAENEQARTTPECDGSGTEQLCPLPPAPGST